jgi:AcrR family transcriptional regulator
VLAKRKTAEVVVNGRGAILDAARALLAEHSGSRFSLAEVAERSGRNIALVSYYFGGKEEMLLALLDEDEKAILGPLQPLEDSELSAEQKLERHIAGVVELHARRPYLSPLIHELLRRSSKAVAQDIANRFVRPVIALQRKILEQGVTEGAFRPFDTTVFYLNVMGGIDMLISARATLQYGFGHRRDDAGLRTQFIHETMSLVMNGLRARK